MDGEVLARHGVTEPTEGDCESACNLCANGYLSTLCSHESNQGHGPVEHFLLTLNEVEGIGRHETFSWEMVDGDDAVNGPQNYVAPIPNCWDLRAHASEIACSNRLLYPSAQLQASVQSSRENRRATEPFTIWGCVAVAKLPTLLSLNFLNRRMEPVAPKV